MYLITITLYTPLIGSGWIIIVGLLRNSSTAPKGVVYGLLLSVS